MDKKDLEELKISKSKYNKLKTVKGKGSLKNLEKVLNKHGHKLVVVPNDKFDDKYNKELNRVFDKINNDFIDDDEEIEHID